MALILSLRGVIVQIVSVVEIHFKSTCPKFHASVESDHEEDFNIFLWFYGVFHWFKPRTL